MDCCYAVPDACKKRAGGSRRARDEREEVCGAGDRCQRWLVLGRKGGGARPLCVYGGNHLQTVRPKSRGLLTN